MPFKITINALAIFTIVDITNDQTEYKCLIMTFAKNKYHSNINNICLADKPNKAKNANTILHCRNHRSITNIDSAKYHCPPAYPYIISNHNLIFFLISNLTIKDFIIQADKGDFVCFLFLLIHVFIVFLISATDNPFPPQSIIKIPCNCFLNAFIK